MRRFHHGSLTQKMINDLFSKLVDSVYHYVKVGLGIILFFLGRRKTGVYVVGDSHTWVFQRRLGVMSIHLGPITLNRFGRNGQAKKLFEAAFRWPKNLQWLPFPYPKATSIIVLSFGEIDVRVHVDRISSERNAPPFEVIDQLAASAISGICELRLLTNARLVFLGPPPPVRNFTDEKYPTSGPFEERVKWMRYLKLQISSRINELKDENVFFCDVSYPFETSDGELNKDFSDGTVHYNRIVGDQLMDYIINL